MGDMKYSFYSFGDFIIKSQIGIISRDKVDNNGNRVVEVLDTSVQNGLKNNPYNVFYIEFKDSWFQED